MNPIKNSIPPINHDWKVCIKEIKRIDSRFHRLFANENGMRRHWWTVTTYPKMMCQLIDLFVKQLEATKIMWKENDPIIMKLRWNLVLLISWLSLLLL